MTKLEEDLRAITPSCGQKYVAGTVAGDPGATYSLGIALNSEDRGDACVLLLNQIPPAAYREILSATWDHDYRELLNACTNAHLPLGELFDYAQFPKPDLPEIVRVWRGTCGITPDDASFGFSWTINRQVACWFAMRYAKQFGSPIVLAADIRRDEIALYHNDRNEDEIVLLDDPYYWWVDGNQQDWKINFEEYKALKNG